MYVVFPDSSESVVFVLVSEVSVTSVWVSLPAFAKASARQVLL